MGGCGDDAVEVEAPAFSAQELCSAYFGVYDTLWDRCCAPGEARRAQQRDSRIAACTASVGASLARGRSTTDGAAFQACIAGRKQRMMDASCIAVDNPEQAMADVAGCSTMILGKGGVGAACDTEDECQNGLTCILYVDPGKGYCVETPELGRSCRQGAIIDGETLDSFTFGIHPLCTEGNTCTIDQDSYTCLPPYDDKGELCDTNGFCGPGRYCHDFVGGRSRCADAAATSEEGGPCPCGPELYCECKGANCDSSDPSTLACRARKSEGSTCQSNIDFEKKGCKGDCVTESAASVDGVCESYCSSG